MSLDNKKKRKLLLNRGKSTKSSLISPMGKEVISTTYHLKPVDEDDTVVRGRPKRDIGVIRNNNAAKGAVILTFDLLIKKIKIYFIGAALGFIFYVLLSFLSAILSIPPLISLIVSCIGIGVWSLYLLSLVIKIFNNLKEVSGSKSLWLNTPHIKYLNRSIRFSKFVIAYYFYAVIATAASFGVELLPIEVILSPTYGYLKVAYIIISVLVTIYAIYSVIASFIYQSNAKSLSV
jgi:hypothetical protein